MFHSQRVEEQVIILLAQRKCRIVSPDKRFWLETEQKGMITYYIVKSRKKGERKTTEYCREISPYMALSYLNKAIELHETGAI